MFNCDGFSNVVVFANWITQLLNTKMQWNSIFCLYLASKSHFIVLQKIYKDERKKLQVCFCLRNEPNISIKTNDTRSKVTCFWILFKSKLFSVDWEAKELFLFIFILLLLFIYRYCIRLYFVWQIATKRKSCDRNVSTIPCVTKRNHSTISKILYCLLFLYLFSWSYNPFI